MRKARKARNEGLLPLYQDPSSTIVAVNVGDLPNTAAAAASSSSAPSVLFCVTDMGANFIFHNYPA